MPFLAHAPAVTLLTIVAVFVETDVESTFILRESSFKENDLLQPDCSLDDSPKDMLVVEELLAIVSQILELPLSAQAPQTFCAFQLVFVVGVDIFYTR